MNINNLGKTISTLRKSANMTQKQLAEDICTQPTISMIEKGEILPSLDTIFFLSIKLNKPLSYFVNILISDNYEYIRKMVAYIEDLTTNQEYEKVFQIVVSELTDKHHDEWFQHFLKWQYYLCAYMLKKMSFKDTISNLKLLLHVNHKLILSKDFLKDRIQNTIAFLYAINKDYKSALFYYNKIKLDNDLIDSPRHDRNIYHLRVLFNKAKTLYDMGLHQESIITIEIGINKSIKLENMSMIGNFYYYLGLCYEKLDKTIGEISHCYKKADFFFTLLGRDIHAKILRENKSSFLR